VLRNSSELSGLTVERLDCSVGAANEGCSGQDGEVNHIVDVKKVD